MKEGEEVTEAPAKIVKHEARNGDDAPCEKDGDDAPCEKERARHRRRAMARRTRGEEETGRRRKRAGNSDGSEEYRHLAQ